VGLFVSVNVAFPNESVVPEPTAPVSGPEGTANPTVSPTYGPSTSETFAVKSWDVPIGFVAVDGASVSTF